MVISDNAEDGRDELGGDGGDGGDGAGIGIGMFDMAAGPISGFDVHRGLGATTTQQ